MPGVIQSSLLAGIPGLSHGFTTRETSAEENALLEAKVATGKQVHKDGILWPSAYERRKQDADAVGTSRPGFYVGIYSADCTPVLLVITDKDRPVAVMAVHAGWRGTALEIVRKSVRSLAVKAMEHRTGPNLKLVAAIGPCIGFSSFEVGEDVVAAFPHALSFGLAKPLRLEEGKQKYLFDLPGENLRQLQAGAAESGLSLEVDSLGLCTLADPKRFPSFRRDRESAGRILSYIAFSTDPA